MLGIEIVIDAQVVLIAIHFVSVSVGQVETILATRTNVMIAVFRPSPPVESVRRRHALELFLQERKRRRSQAGCVVKRLAIRDRSALVVAAAEQDRLPPEDRLRRGCDRVAVASTAGFGLLAFVVIDAREIPEDAGLCHVGQREAAGLIPLDIALAFK